MPTRQKWMVLTVAMMMVAGVQAGDKKNDKDSAGSMTKAAFVEAAQKRAEKAGTAFDAAKTDTAFAAKDTNKDGVLTADELAAARANNQKKAGEKSSK